MNRLSLIKQARRQVENVYRYVKWHIDRSLNRPNTLAPIQWTDEKPIEIPSSLLNQSQETDLLLKSIKREIELFSSLSNYFPERPLRKSDWLELLERKTMKERIDYIKFIRQIEIKEGKDKIRRMKRKMIRYGDDSSTDVNKLGGDDRRFGPLPVLTSKHDDRENYMNISRALQAYNHLPRRPELVIDCRYLPSLSPRGASLTAQQMLILASNNRERNQPWNLSLCMFDESDKRIQKLNTKYLQFSYSRVPTPFIYPSSITSVFPPERVVYLSPDAEEELEVIEDDKVYVIGGIVDRVTEHAIPRKASLEAAQSEGVRAVKLPIDRYVEWKSGNRFLTLVAVMNILQDVYDNDNDWNHMTSHIPARNLRAAEEKNGLNRAQHQRIREYDSRIRKMIINEMSKEGTLN